MGIALKAGEKIPLHLVLESRDTTKFVRATIRNEAGVEIGASPVAVAHLADGAYFDDSVSMPDTPNIMVRYEIYDDAFFTTPSGENLPSDERFDRDDLASLVDDIQKDVLRGDNIALISEPEEFIATAVPTEAVADASVIEALATTVEEKDVQAVSTLADPSEVSTEEP